MSILVPVRHSLDYSNFAVIFEIRKYESSKFSLLDCFDFVFFVFFIVGAGEGGGDILCISTKILGSACQFVQKRQLRIFIGIALNLEISWEYYHLNNVKSSNT